MPMGELTKQNSWTRIPVSKSVCPQMSGSTSAWPHSAHTAEERANASSGEQLAGPDVPEGCPQGPALCLPCWLEHLPPGQISNWDNLIQAFAGNFQGTYVRPGNSWDL